MWENLLEKHPKPAQIAKIINNSDNKSNLL